MQWWEKGTYVPPLVTTAPLTTTAPYTGQNPGKLGDPGTQVLFGGDYVNDKSVSGGRLQVGMWLNRCATIGFEGEYFALDDQITNYYQWSDGTPIIARPFFDVNPASTGQAVELVAYPRGSPFSVDGAINISVSTRFYGTGAHFLFTTCREEGSWTDDCGSCTTYHDRFRADVIVGYRYLDLQDQLGITETITGTDPNTTARNQRFSGQRSVQYPEHVQRCRCRHEVRTSAKSLVVGHVPPDRLRFHALHG